MSRDTSCLSFDGTGLDALAIAEPATPGSQKNGRPRAVAVLSKPPPYRTSLMDRLKELKDENQRLKNTYVSEPLKSKLCT